MMKYYLAPMEGITGYIYRNALETFFPGADRYFTPFIVPDQKRTLRTKELRDILPEHNHVRELIPQILTNDAQRFLEAAQALEAYGYREVNLNLGCPSGTVVSHGRGAGFLARPEELDAFLEQIFSGCRLRISIKTRIGMERPEEAYRLMEIYNQYPVSELIIHPRTRSEFYRGEPHQELYGELLHLCKMPVCYNGNLLTKKEVRSLEARFPMTSRIMLGRGVIAAPDLIRRLVTEGTKTGTEHAQAAACRGDSRIEGVGDSHPVQMKLPELKQFHDTVFNGYCEAFGEERNAMFRMKELWIYLIHSFADAGKQGKRIRKASSPAEYRAEVNRLFREYRLCVEEPEVTIHGSLKHLLFEA